MFRHDILGVWPWERDIKPDASSDACDVYIESGYTDYLKHELVGKKPIESMKNWYVALCKFSDGYLSWTISDGIGVLDEATELEALFIKCDKWKLIENGKI